MTNCRVTLPTSPSARGCECRLASLAFTARYAERADDGGEDGDDEIYYFLDGFFLHDFFQFKWLDLRALEVLNVTCFLERLRRQEKWAG